MTTAPSPASAIHRFETFLHAVAFVLGFSTVFVILGMALGELGRLLSSFVDLLAQASGSVVIIFGLFTMGVVNIPFLNYDTRRQFAGWQGAGFIPALASSYVMGVLFSAGWTPCVGPTLGAILTLSLKEGTVSQGAFLLVGYSLGLGIPFLLVGLAVDRATSALRKLRRFMPAIKMATGGLLVLIGILLWVDAFHISMPLWVPTLRNLKIWAVQSPFQQSLFTVESDLTPAGASPTFFVAVLAGLLSFLSPCVLPLVPLYISYLGGRAVGGMGRGT